MSQPDTAPYYSDESVTLYHGDCIDVLRQLPDNSVDSVVTDPPYGLEFMGKEWDKFGRDTGNGYRETPRINDRSGEAFPGHRTVAPNSFQAGRPFQAWCESWAVEALRVLKPGGHLLACGGSRTHHRLMAGVEDAGFEIRDCISWIFGSGFPKSLNVTDALGRIVPPDARCVCGPRSTRTVPDSRDGYPSSHGFGGGQPHLAGADVRASVPSLDDAPGRTHDGRPAGGPSAGPASNAPGAETGRPSTVGSPHPSAPPGEADPPDASAPSDTQTSTSGAPGPESRRTADHTQHTSGSAAGSASASSWRNQYMSCPDCGGVAIPQGLGTALKPATEFIVVARKPLTGTVAASVLAHGTCALNIDACRIGHGETLRAPQSDPANRRGEVGKAMQATGGIDRNRAAQTASIERTNLLGRWPANVVLDESQAAALDQMSGQTTSNVRVSEDRDAAAATWSLGRTGMTPRGVSDSGGASRFYYTAKADAGERVRVNGTAHPTVKPLSLMRWLVRLVTPPGGTVLDPFAGSGTTGEACILEGFACVLIEREADYLPLIVQRINRQRDPIAYTAAAGEDLGLFDFGELA